MKIQASAFLLAVAASSSNAFVTKPVFSASRTAAPLKEAALDTFDLPSIEDEVSCRRIDAYHHEGQNDFPK
jgi:hypothetical protein